MKLNNILLFAVLGISILSFSSCGPKYTLEEQESYTLVLNQGGATLGYAPASGVTLLESKGFAFKDLNRNGTLDAYEDWRLPVDERISNLVGQMSVEQIAGLMLYSAHQAVPSGSRGFMAGTYGSKTFEESGTAPSDLSDQQRKFLSEDHVRHVLVTSVKSPATAANWNNNMQTLVEGIGLGIPANTSSDPRHRTQSSAEFDLGSGSEISMWPASLGIAATFDPEVMRQFGEIASIEYRALGIATALSPQIDLASEPRWSRFSGTMGEDPLLASDMARAYVDGFQTSTEDHEILSGWGYHSVNAMVKHWPGGGPEEGGRDAHFGYGAYAVYPGNNLKDHLFPFTEGVFKLEGATGMASAIMPYYTISTDIDSKYGENVGNAYNKYLITDLLREKYGYEGVVCTDWRVTADAASLSMFSGMSWGVEHLSVAERHYKVLEAGGDQFGGNNEMGPVMEAYRMGVSEHGEEYMRERFELSATRLLRNIFRVGLFENSYVDPESTEEIVGNPDYMKAGYDAQLKSVVLLKNKSQVLPIKQVVKVYMPRRFIPAGSNWFGMSTPERWIDTFNPDIIKTYFELVDSPNEADIALLGIQSPNGGSGYDESDVENGGTGYVPISLQYGPYKAEHARETSLAGGSPFEDFTNRSYKDKSTTATNHPDLELVLKTRKEMGEKPLIVVVNVSKPMVFSEFEHLADAILAHMGVQDQAVMDLLSGANEPSGLLPFQMPANMKTVEEQLEDVPRDMTPHTDSEGNAYDFAFGLNWNGVIQDDRVAKYK